MAIGEKAEVELGNFLLCEQIPYGIKMFRQAELIFFNVLNLNCM